MSHKKRFAFLIALFNLFFLAGAGRALAQSQLSASQSSINFGSINVGGSAQQQIKLTNATKLGITVTTITVSGKYFSISGFTTPISLAAGASVSLNAKFAPGSTGSQTGKIEISGRGLTATLDIQLAGNGTSQSQVSIQMVPSSVTFGSVPVGTTNSQTITVKNGGSSAISVASQAAGGSGFSMSGLADGLTISPGKSTTFNVAFKPVTTGAVTGSASVNFKAAGQPIPKTVWATGTGVSSTISLKVSPTAMNFGTVTAGKSSSITLKVSNAGNSEITISRSTITGSGFSVNGLASLILQAGQSDTVSVVFSPGSAGNYSGNLSIVAGSATASVTLSGSSVSGSTVSHTVSLSWSPSSSSNVTGYYVQRGTVSGGPYQLLNSSPIASTSYVDSTVKAGQEYFYVIVAVNSEGLESQPSEQVNATIPLF